MGRREEIEEEQNLLAGDKEIAAQEKANAKRQAAAEQQDMTAVAAKMRAGVEARDAETDAKMEARSRAFAAESDEVTRRIDAERRRDYPTFGERVAAEREAELSKYGAPKESFSDTAMREHEAELAKHDLPAAAEREHAARWGKETTPSYSRGGLVTHKLVRSTPTLRDHHPTGSRVKERPVAAVKNRYAK